MTKKEAKIQEQQEAINDLWRAIKPQDTILIAIKSVSQSGMCRRMRVMTKEFEDITGLISKACDISMNDIGLKITGCGMDMTFGLADYISQVLGPSDKAKKLFLGNGGSCIKGNVI